jgi:hypothetical protein
VATLHACQRGIDGDHVRFAGRFLDFPCDARKSYSFGGSRRYSRGYVIAITRQLRVGIVIARRRAFLERQQDGSSSA